MRTNHRPQSPSAIRRGITRSALARAGLTAALLTGCSFRIEEAMCGAGEYPVLAVGGTGGSCVPNGEEHPAGCARCPEGKVPEHVGDEWDPHGSTRTLDGHGHGHGHGHRHGDVVAAPDAA
ncbi:SCO0607 family lipoprotein [Streptomyces sp. NPDC088766]|uniref:SCO0607 family lipoprotein n=1 Tax=Streptomyces sp. NPDC088766 TaxID=3365893 RepID=UPI0038020C16